MENEIVSPLILASGGIIMFEFRGGILTSPVRDIPIAFKDKVICWPFASIIHVPEGFTVGGK
jgi:hypothetical protein